MVKSRESLLDHFVSVSADLDPYKVSLFMFLLEQHIWSKKFQWYQVATEQEFRYNEVF